MEAQNVKKPLWLSILRWSTLISSILFIIVAIVLIIWLSQELRWSVKYNLFIVFVPLIAYIIGLIICFWKAAIGGLISLASLAFSLIYLRFGPGLRVYEIYGFCIMFLPCILNVLYWYFHRRWAPEQIN